MTTKRKGGRPPLDRSEKVRRYIETSFGRILDKLTEHLDEEEKVDLNLEGTPKRVAKMWVNEILAYPDPPDTDALCITPAPGNPPGIVALGPIGFASTCAHHVLPFTGHAWIAYLPGEHVMGLSKFTRVVRAFSKRLQIQEKLTADVLEYLVEQLAPKAMVVVFRGSHGCISCRGVEDPLQATVSSNLYYSGMEENELSPPESLVNELYRAIDLSTPTLK